MFTTKHRSKVLATVGLAIALTLAIAGCSSHSNSGPETKNAAKSVPSYGIKVGFIANTARPTNPEGFYDESGGLLANLKSAGVTKVTWLPFKNGPDLSAALSGGSLDLGILGDTPALTSYSSGVKSRLVNQESLGQDTWLFAKKGGPTTIAGLAGKTVATQVGSYMYRYLLGVLDQQGLTGKVKVTHIYTTAAVAALKSGGIAAYAAPAGQLTAAMQAAGFPIIDKASVDHTDLLGTSVTVIASSSYAKHPGLVAAWNTARTAAIDYSDAHSAAYYTYAAKAGQTTEDVIKSSLPLSRYASASFTPAGLAKLTSLDSFLLKQKLIKTPIDFSAWRTA